MLNPLLLFVIALFSSSIFSEEQKQNLPLAGLLTSLDGEPSAIVDGMVNAISGEVFDYEIDLTLPGPESFRVERVLMGNNSHPILEPIIEGPEWRFAEHGLVTFHEQDPSYMHKNVEASYEGPLGEYQLFEFRRKNSHEVSHSSTSQKMLTRGVTNNSRGVISSQTNVRNTHFKWDKDSRFCEITTGNGTKLKFLKETKNKIGSIYSLQEEIRPNLLKMTQEYDSSHHVIKKELKNSLEVSLASYHIEETKSDNRIFITYTASDARKVRYTYSQYKHERKGYYKPNACTLLRHVLRDDAPPIHYDYHEGKVHKHEKQHFYEWPKLSSKILPDQRITKFEYYSTGNHSIKLHADRAIEKSPDFCRIRTLLAPIGASPHLLPKYQFIYYLPNGPGKGGCTGVYDALNHKTDTALMKGKGLPESPNSMPPGRPIPLKIFIGDKKIPQKKSNSKCAPLDLQQVPIKPLPGSIITTSEAISKPIFSMGI
jgi:hypothetical protein